MQQMCYESVVQMLGQKLTRIGWSLVTAESCTGGGIAQACTSIAGSSQWFDRGLVTYSNQAKQDLLDVSEQTLLNHGAVSEETVREMLQGALNQNEKRLGLAVSGIAGPGGGSPEKPVGTVWFCWGDMGNMVSSMQQFSGDRCSVQRQAVEYALRQLAAWDSEESQSAG